MYEDRRLDELESYNRKDVEALRSLVQLDRIRLSDGRMTKIGTLGGTSGGSRVDHPSRYPPDDPRSLKQGSAEWKRARVGLITASIAGAALGVRGSFLSRNSVAAKLHAQLNGIAYVDETEPNDSRRLAMERGARLEATARREYERLLNVRVDESGLHPHPRKPEVLAASPDGIVILPDGELSDIVVEIKVPRANTRGAGLSDSYLCQLQLTMVCTSTRFADFVVLLEQNGTRRLSITRVERDNSMIDVMEGMLIAFFSEAKLDDELFPIETKEAARLQLALLDARTERVGPERVYLLVDEPSVSG